MFDTSVVNDRVGIFLLCSGAFPEFPNRSSSLWFFAISLRERLFRVLV